MRYDACIRHDREMINKLQEADTVSSTYLLTNSSYYYLFYCQLPRYRLVIVRSLLEILF
jgi:hypothetical protein